MRPGYLLCLLTALALQPVCASGLRISPLQVDLAAQQSSTRLDLHNAGPVDTVVDIRVLAWSQAGGEDSLQPSSELIAVPPVVRIPAGKQQAIRVGFARTPQPSTIERSYRLQVTELPARTGPGPQFQLRLLLPVFVAPSEPPRIATELRLEQAAGKVVVQASNAGNVHAKIVGLSLLDAAGRILHSGVMTSYVLPGSQARVEVSVRAPLAGLSGAEAKVMHGSVQQASKWPIALR